MLPWLLFVPISILYAELVGYIIHRLVHSDKIRALSRSHMIHHLLLYGPDKPLRSTEYLTSTDGRFSFAKLGIEWLIPSAIAIAILATLGMLFSLTTPMILTTIAVALAWSIAIFEVLHVDLHLTSTRLQRSRLTSRWFRSARRLHDIHHRSISENGLMEANFGIGFFLFDRLFGTFAPKERKPSAAAIETALKRYSFIQTTDHPAHRQTD